MPPAEDIRPGDWVLSRDEQTGEQAYKPVLKTFVTRPDRLYHVRYRTADGLESELVSTGEHPFYVAGREDSISTRETVRGFNSVAGGTRNAALVEAIGFVAAKELRAGDELRLTDGQPAHIISVGIEDAAPGETFTTYNFEVADFHSYFVGTAGVWVHNRAAESCERIFAYVERLKTKHTLTDEQAFNRMIEQVKNVPARRKMIAPHLHYAAHSITHTKFKAFANGSVRLSALTTVADMKTATAGLRLASKLDVHHIAPQEWAIQYLKQANPTKFADLPDTVKAAREMEKYRTLLDSMPGSLIHQFTHRDLGDGIATFNRILNGKLTPGNHNYEPDEILRALDDTYSQWSSAFTDDYVNLGPNMVKAAKKWLEDTAQ